MTKTVEHLCAEELVKLVSRVENRKPFAYVKVDVRLAITHIESEFDEKGRLEILRSFFGQISMANVCLLFVAEICPFFSRLDRQSKLPLEELRLACLEENPDRIANILKSLENT